MTRYTDILADSPIGTIRIEVMWRKRTSRAEIANYVLTKVWQYGQSLGVI
jgi:lipid A disaccharide synthetase